MNDDESRIAEWIKKAAALSENAPTPLREAAFKAAFDLLSGSSHASAGASRVSKSVGLTQPRRRTRSAGVVGPKAAVAELIEEGYFDTPKGVAQVRDHLSSVKGRRFERKHVATAVLRLVRDGALQRVRGSDGEYEYNRRH